MSTNKKLIYFPSFSAGVLSNSIKRGDKFRNGIPVNFTSNEFPSDFRHPYFLITAGHLYKKLNYSVDSKLRVASDTVILGDSGGYQIATGAIKWNKSLLPLILEFLELNSDIAMNLDIPPRRNNAGKFNECLDISIENFKYFEKHQKGKIKLLNILHGHDDCTYMQWYDKVKNFEFSGWGVGGCIGSIYNLSSAIMTLLNGKEHLNPTREYVHILGTTRVTDFLILEQLQLSLNEIGSSLQVMTDSSTPSLRGSKYGDYFYGIDLNKGVIKSLHIPKIGSETTRDKIGNGENKFDESSSKLLPEVIDFDKYLRGAYSYDDMKEWNIYINNSIIIHNLMFFKYAMDMVYKFVDSHTYFISQVCSKNTVMLLKCIDEMVKAYENGTTPYDVFMKYKIFLKSFESQKVIEHTENTFF